jgi:hypothetical protein
METEGDESRIEHKRSEGDCEGLVARSLRQQKMQSLHKLLKLTLQPQAISTNRSETTETQKGKVEDAHF